MSENLPEKVLSALEICLNKYKTNLNILDTKNINDNIIETNNYDKRKELHSDISKVVATYFEDEPNNLKEAMSMFITSLNYIAEKTASIDSDYYRKYYNYLDI